MEPKTYGLETLALICAGRTGATDAGGWIANIERAIRPPYDKAEPRYKVRDGGLWRNTSPAFGAATAELDVLEWQPFAGDTKPALPIPFTAGEFAAFTMAGFGVMVIERFEGIDDEDELNEDELGKLGRNGADAKEVLREAHRLRLVAVQRFGINIAKVGEPPTLQLDDASTDEAAAWLLNDAHQETVAAAAVVHMPAGVDADSVAGTSPQPHEGPPALKTPEIADAFDGISGHSAQQWRDMLGDMNNHQWLKAALATQGKAPRPSTWWPLKFADLLLERGATRESLNRAFVNAPKLKQWLPNWQQAKRERDAFGL